MTFFFFYTWLSSIRPSCYITSHDPEPEGWIVVSSILHYLALLKSQIPSIHPSIFCPFSGSPRAPLPVLPREHCPAKLCSLTTCPGSALQSTHAQNSYHSEGVLLECPQDAACIWDFFWVFFGYYPKIMAVVEGRNADQLLMPQQSVRPPPPLSCH